MHRCSPETDTCRQKNNRALPEVLRSAVDDVTSGPQSGICRSAGPTQDADTAHCRPAVCAATDLFHQPPPCDKADDLVTDPAAVVVGECTTATTRAATSCPCPRATTTTTTTNHSRIFCDRLTSGGVASSSCNRLSSDGGDVPRSEASADDDDQVNSSAVVSQQQRNIAPSSSSPFHLDGSLPSVDASGFMRRRASSQSSLLEVYAESPGSRRRDQQQRRSSVHPFEEELGRPLNDDVRRRHTDESPRRGYRHGPDSHRSGRAPSKQVSSSFENLVGSLLAVPYRRRHLANSTEELDPAASLCGRGAATLPSLAAFTARAAAAEEAPGTAPGGDRTPSSSSPRRADPVLRRGAPPQRARRVKHLFKSCQSCVQHDPAKT